MPLSPSHQDGPFDLFDKSLCVPTEEIDIELRGIIETPWSDFYLNPRRLRGSDFLMRWSQGTWSEQRLIQAIQETEHYFALPYGPSSVAPDQNIQEFEHYFERLEKAGLGKRKRPDLLIFRNEEQEQISHLVATLGGTQELPFISEDTPDMQQLIARAILAVECENSLWVAQDMPDYGAKLRPQRRLGGQLGLKKAAVLPTIILKEEDRFPLHQWQQQAGLPIHIWHVFYDLAFGISLEQVEHLIQQGKIEPTVQRFQAPGGATSEKAIYKVYYHYAYPLGKTSEAPNLLADHIKDKNGHILPFVRFEGGALTISREALDVLKQLSALHQE